MIGISASPSTSPGNDMLGFIHASRRVTLPAGWTQRHTVAPAPFWRMRIHHALAVDTFV